jgi:hypothetical protein
MRSLVVIAQGVIDLRVLHASFKQPWDHNALIACGRLDLRWLPAFAAGMPHGQTLQRAR